jgi:hypothetical protein
MNRVILLCLSHSIRINIFHNQKAPLTILATTKMANVLIACEESQAVCIAFRAAGHNAYSCDLLPCSGGHPEWHIQGDAKQALKAGSITLQNGITIFIEKWNLLIAHPTCTFLTNSGVRWLFNKDGSKNESRFLQLLSSIAFFNCFQDFHKATGIPVAIENPIPHKYARDGFDFDNGAFRDGELSSIHSVGIGKYTQVIQPWQFGHEQMKATCLWLYGLPKLEPTNIVGPPPKDKQERLKWQDCWLASPGPDRQKIRSKTYSGIAQAMADQWGKLI